MPAYDAKHFEEQKKAQDAEWARRKASGEGSSTPAKPFIVRSEYGILPEEGESFRIRTKQILARHIELMGMPYRMLEMAWEIGFELIALKEMVYHGQWTPFCENALSEVSLRKIEQYMQLAKGKDRLLAKYANPKHSFDFETLPPIRDALADIQTWSREEREQRGKPPIKSRPKEKRASRTIEVKATVTRTESEKVPPPVSNAPESPPAPLEGSPIETLIEEVVETLEGKPADENLDSDELDAAYYWADQIREEAPHLWAMFCPDCQALLGRKGERVGKRLVGNQGRLTRGR